MNTIQCPECGNQMPDTDTVCKACGFPLEKAKQMPEQQINENSNVVKVHKLAFCPDCGSAVSPDAKSCPRCGKPLQDKRKIKIATYAISVVAALCIGYVGGTVLPQHKSMFTSTINQYNEKNASVVVATSTPIAQEKPRYDLNDERSLLDQLWSDVTDFWNAVCDLDWYNTRGTSCTGTSLDADLTFTKLERIYSDYLPLADDVFNSMTDSKYDYLKTVWGKFYKEATSFYNRFKNNPPIKAFGYPNGLDIGRLNQYTTEFGNEARELLGY